MINALTVDLEDWYHVCGTGENSLPSKWAEYESRVTSDTNKVLSLLRTYDTKATFFVLGYIAEREPTLIKSIHGEGHEIAIHGYYHKRLFELNREEFEEDVKKSKEIVESITGEKVLGYRAPEWSIRNNTLWALSILKKLGIEYDSSMVPLTKMGERNFGLYPYVIKTEYGNIVEFPLTTMRCLWENLPFTGGLPLRISPYWYTVSKLRQINRKYGQPGIVYVHPWEFDNKQIKIELPLSRRFMHYFRITATRPKLVGLLKHLKFAPIKDVIGLT